jgi:hypothetical protein
MPSARQPEKEEMLNLSFFDPKNAVDFLLASSVDSTTTVASSATAEEAVAGAGSSAANTAHIAKVIIAGSIYHLPRTAAACDQRHTSGE